MSERERESGRERVGGSVLISHSAFVFDGGGRDYFTRALSID